MPMKQTGRKQYKSMQGKSIDMDLLRQKNELTPAVGNVKVNARGDELGAGGKIVRTREQVLQDYYDSNPGMPDEDMASRQQLAEEAEEKVSDPLVVENNDEEWEELRNLVSWAYANNYYHKTSDTDAFNTMSDKVEGIYEEDD